MGIISNKTTEAEKEVSILTKQEVKFLLSFISQSAFKGENVKILCSIVEKLEKILNN